MVTHSVQVVNEVGLHARPAALFVKEVKRFQSCIRVRNMTTNSEWIQANSLLRLLTLGVEQGHQIEISAEGEDEEAAVQALVSVVETGLADENS